MKNYCKNCNKKISRNSVRCNSCARKGEIKNE